MYYILKIKIFIKIVNFYKILKVFIKYMYTFNFYSIYYFEN